MNNETIEIRKQVLNFVVIALFVKMIQPHDNKLTN